MGDCTTFGGKLTHWLMKSIQDINLEATLRSKRLNFFRIVGKEYPEKSMTGNIFVSISGESRFQLKVFRHDFKKTRSDKGGKQVKCDFFQVTSSVVPQSYPTASNSVAWTEKHASKPLPPRTRHHVDFTSSSQFLPMDVSGTENKKRKYATETQLGLQPAESFQQLWQWQRRMK